MRSVWQAISSSPSVASRRSFGRPRRRCEATLLISPCERASRERPLSPSLVLLMAIGCGAAVANIYYAQPLLSTIAHEFSISDGTAGLLVTASQVGYAAGLVLLVPLGDLLERRRLITRILLVTALALAATAAAPSFSLLAAALLVVGVTSVVAQILVPLASTLAAERERGRVVGKVMSGLLVGILVARTASGIIAELGGWRLVFGLSAALMVALSAVLRTRLPEVRPPTTLSYPGVLRSVGRLVAEHPTLRVRMLYGALGMGAVQRPLDDDRVPARRLALPLRRLPRSACSASSGSPARSPRRRRGGWPTAASHHLSTGLFFATMLALLGVDRRRQILARGADPRDRGARPRHPGRADHQPERDLRAGPRCPQPRDDRLHDDRLRLAPPSPRRSRRRSTRQTAGAVWRRSAPGWPARVCSCGSPNKGGYADAGAVRSTRSLFSVSLHNEFSQAAKAFVITPCWVPRGGSELG